MRASSQKMMRPLAASIRSSLSGRSGLWSEVSASASIRASTSTRLFLEAATALAPTPTAPSVRMGTGASNSETGTRDHGAPLLEVLAVGDKRVNSVARRHRLELRWLGCTALAAAEDEAAKRVCPVARVPACLSHGATSVIGWRREMEDAVAIAAPFLPATTVAEVKGKSCTENGGGKLKDREKGFFVVFDGHGGLRVAEACRERMHMVLAEDVDRLWAGDYKDDQNAVRWKEAMAACFARVDGEVGGTDEYEDTDGGRRE
jgi:protein phosphatase 2C